MNPFKQCGTILLFVILALGLFFPVMFFAKEGFEMARIGFISFIICFVALSVLVTFIIKDELKNREDSLNITNRAKVIFEFHYKQKEWNDFALQLYKDERNSYFKIYSIVSFCFIVFLFFLAQDDDLQIFIMFSFIIGMIMIPILITNLLKYRNRKRIYLTDAKPSIKVTNRGVIINSKIHHSFSYINSKLESVEIKDYASVPCFVLTTFHPSTNRGGTFKTSYILIPENEKKNKSSYLKKIEELLK